MLTRQASSSSTSSAVWKSRVSAVRGKRKTQTSSHRKRIQCRRTALATATGANEEEEVVGEDSDADHNGDDAGQQEEEQDDEMEEEEVVGGDVDANHDGDEGQQEEEQEEEQENIAGGNENTLKAIEELSSDEEENQMTADTEAAAAEARQRGGGRGRGRERVNDIPLPNVEGLTELEVDAAISEYERAKWRAASSRSRAAKKARQLLATENSSPLEYRTLNVIRAQAGGAKARLAEGLVYKTKEAFQHAVREYAECMSLRIRFNSNNTSLVKCECTNISPHNFSVAARYRGGKLDSWIVTSSVILGTAGGAPIKKEEKTAYRDIDLQCMVQGLIKEEPSISAKLIRKTLEPYLAYVESLEDHIITRVRRMAMTTMFGKPNDNVKKLPALQRLLLAEGHHMKYETIDAASMASVVLHVAKTEHERAAAAARKVPVAQRTLRQVQDAQSWPLIARQRWQEENQDLLMSIQNSGKEYVEWVEVSFNHGHVVYCDLLQLINMDGCHCTHLLDAYTMLLVVGLDSNMETVPLYYIYVCGNESTDTWMRAQQAVKERFPDLETMRTTFTTDQEKGLQNAIDEVWGENNVHFVCGYHRKKNLARHGKKTVKVFHNLSNAPTVAKMNAIVSSASYRAITDNGRGALESVPNHRQYLAAAAQRGALTYGKSTSQAVESVNSALKLHGVRCLDVMTSILKALQRDKKRFDAHYEKAWNSTARNTPWATAKLDKLDAGIGTVHDLVHLDTELKTHYYVMTHGSTQKFQVTLLNPNVGDNEDTYFGSCECGVPKRDNFPCDHMMTVARVRMLPENKIVPMEFTVETWKLQYPGDHAFRNMTTEDVEAAFAQDPGDGGNLAMPVTCPPKRGRPPTNRKRSAVEKAVKRNRRRNGDE